MSIKEKLALLPEKSGVYIMRDDAGEIIYIGKAVLLTRRVRQYFNNSPKPVKVQAMVDSVADFDYIITLSEKDALALEANLIRKHKPRYNILLKDDKHSPYIKIDLKQKYPTIEVTRKVKRDGARYFGPFFGGIKVGDIISVIRSAYKMRACPKKLGKRDRACLNYDIGLCYAPCMGYISPEEYRETVQKVMKFLSGYEDSAQKLLEEKMADAVAREQFERAITYRDQLEMLKKLRERTVANLGSVTDIDAIAYAESGNGGVVSVCVVRGNKMMGVKNYEITDASMSFGEVISTFLAQYYGGNNEIPQEICIEEKFDTTALADYLHSLCGRTPHITFPQKGARKRLVDTARQNASDYMLKRGEKSVREWETTVGASKALAEVLGIKSARRIECYDISHISGTDKVASQSVFIDGKSSPSDYRKYAIKTVEGNNDFACMEEVLRRRLTRAIGGDEKFTALPDLIVIDGGKGQLSYAYAVMKELGFDIPMVSLAEREEEIFVPNKSEPILLPKSHYALKLLQRVRDEAHRFAVTFHRGKRSKRLFSELDEINGIGPKRRKILLKAFPSVAQIKQASVETLASVDGIDRKTAHSVYAHFHKNEEND